MSKTDNDLTKAVNLKTHFMDDKFSGTTTSRIRHFSEDPPLPKYSFTPAPRSDQ